MWAEDLPFEVIGGDANARRVGWTVSKCPLKLVNYELLTRDAMPVTDVCLAVGYESLGSFSSRFHALVGRPPSEFQRRLRRIFPVPQTAIYRFIPSCYLLQRGLTPF